MDTPSSITVITALRQQLENHPRSLDADDIPAPVVVEALQHTLGILSLRLARETRLGGLPENAGKSWQDWEDSMLLMERRADMSVSDMAAIHGRRQSSIQRRLEKLLAQKAMK